MSVVPNRKDSSRFHHVLFDVETMGRMPYAKRPAIVSIAAVKFDRSRIIDQRSFNVDLSSSLRLGLDVDGDTVSWWLRQSEEARSRLLLDPVDLITAMNGVLEIVSPLHLDMVWGNGASFDIPIVKEALHSCGLRIPWGRKQEACYRTIRLQYGLPFDPYGTEHVAIDDAIRQVRHLQKIARMFPSALITSRLDEQ